MWKVLLCWVFELKTIRTQITVGTKITIDTEMKAKRDNIISELITLRITKAKAKENWGGGGSMKFTLNWLSCQKIIGINKFKKAKAKAKKYVGGINFTLISVSTV